MRLRSRAALVDRLEIGDMSEREVARRAGLGQATVNHLVTGRRDTCRADTALLVEQVLGMPVGSLFSPETADEHAEMAAFRQRGSAADPTEAES